MCNSWAATRLGHARRRSLNWSGCVCCHHCRGASDEPPSSPLQSPPPLKPPHQRRRAYPGIEPGLHACVRRRRCLRWRRRRRRRRQQQQRRRGVYVECTYVGWLVVRPAALAAALAPRGHRARPHGRPRERSASAARGRRATCRHEVNVFSFTDFFGVIIAHARRIIFGYIYRRRLRVPSRFDFGSGSGSGSGENSTRARTSNCHARRSRSNNAFPCARAAACSCGRWGSVTSRETLRTRFGRHPHTRTSSSGHSAHSLVPHWAVSVTFWSDIATDRVIMRAALGYIAACRSHTSMVAAAPLY